MNYIPKENLCAICKEKPRISESKVVCSECAQKHEKNTKIHKEGK